MSSIDELMENMDRLESHLDAVSGGSLVARDDIASVLQILLRDGEGYDLVNRALADFNLPPLMLKGFENARIERVIAGKDVALAIRPLNNITNVSMPVNALLEQEAVYHDQSEWSTESSISWAELINKSRNKHGSHVDSKPPQWLEDLRIYPVANADIVTFLLWTFGEELLAGLSYHLGSNGYSSMVHSRRTVLNGLSIRDAHVLHVPPTSILAGANTMLTVDDGRKRTVFGGVYSSTPFLVGINTQRNAVLLRGENGSSLEELESNFLLGAAGQGLNRQQRRAMRKSQT